MSVLDWGKRIPTFCLPVYLLASKFNFLPFSYPVFSFLGSDDSIAFECGKEKVTLQAWKDSQQWPKNASPSAQTVESLRSDQDLHEVCLV